MSPSGPIFFGAADRRAAKRFIEKRYGSGAFDDATAKIEDEILSASVASTRDYMLQSRGCRNLKGEFFKVYPALIRTTTTNAVAVLRDDVHICGLHYGLYLTTFELCLAAMGHGKVFAEIGDAAGELSKSRDKRTPVAFWSLDQVIRHGVISDRAYAATIGPSCPVRYNFAVALTLMMLRFFWFHEMYHCLNGHLGALSMQVPDLCLTEVQEEAEVAGLIGKERGVLPLDYLSFRRALELDADRSALWGCFQTQLQDKENIIGIQGFPQETRIVMCLFVAYLATYLFDQINLRSIDQSIKTHPHAYTRWHDLIRTTASHLIDASPEGSRPFQRVMTELLVLREVVPQLVDPDVVLAHCRDERFQGMLDHTDRELELSRRHFSAFAFNATE